MAAQTPARLLGWAIAIREKKVELLIKIPLVLVRKLEKLGRTAMGEKGRKTGANEKPFRGVFKKIARVLVGGARGPNWKKLSNLRAKRLVRRSSEK